MKKVLFAGTALVAAGLMGAGTASASDKIKLSLGGYSKWWVVGAWQENSYQASQAAAINNVDVKGDNEIWFGGQTTLDNGLTVGVNIEMEAGGHTDQRTDTIDKSFVFVEGGFGKLILGSEANGAVLLHVMAPDAAGNNASDGILTGGFAVAQPGNVIVKTTTELDTDDNADKMTYVSPSIYGLTVGGSYIPNLSEDNRGAATNPVQVYGVGALYAREIGPVGLKVSGGHIWYDAGAANALSTEWSAGTQLAMAGFTVGGSYRKVNDNFRGSNATGGTSGTIPGTSFAGRTWDAGVQYTTGPWAVSFIYVDAAAVGTVATPGNDTQITYQASAKYTLGPGVDLLATGGFTEYDDETTKASTNDANHNKGWAIMSGLSLSF